MSSEADCVISPAIHSTVLSHQIIIQSVIKTCPCSTSRNRNWCKLAFPLKACVTEETWCTSALSEKFTSLPRNSQVNDISSGLPLAWPNPCKQLLIPRKCPMCSMPSEFSFLSWCCRWAAPPQPSQMSLTCSHHTHCWCSLQPHSAPSDAGFFQAAQLLLPVLCRGRLSSGFGE